jgi:TonB family protein
MARNSLITPEHGTVPIERWDHRTGQTARVWGFALSILAHIALFYFAGDWLESSRLASVESPFMVNLVAPVVREEPATAVPEEEVIEAQEREPEPEAMEEIPEETSLGVPEAMLLEPDPIIEDPGNLLEPEPILGDTVALAPEPVKIIRRDVASEATERLLEQMNPVPDLPVAVSRPLPAAQQATPIGSRTGAEAGIEGPLGKRGLIYFEFPAYPDWAEEAGIETEVRFRFWVSPAGNVIRVLALRKSAYPETESLAREALSRWRFEPLPRGAERDEWGEVPIKWRLK